MGEGVGLIVGVLVGICVKVGTSVNVDVGEGGTNVSVGVEVDGTLVVF